jgi:phosphatidate cytidylyltransferase
MLKKRITTALIILPLVILSILYLPTTVFSIVALLFFLVALWEWTRLAGFNKIWARSLALIGLPLVMLLLLGVLYTVAKEPLLFKILPIIILGFWMLATFLVFTYNNQSNSKTILEIPLVALLAGGFVLIPCFSALLALQQLDPQWLLYVLMLIWTADSGAYFAGRKFGKHKLAVAVSPGKTWEGVIGALAGCFLTSILGFIWLAPGLSLISWIGLSMITVLFSIVGDLFESLFKRMQNLKDSGTLFPGHGGMLDRIDSLTSALPIFVLGLMFSALMRF